MKRLTIRSLPLLVSVLAILAAPIATCGEEPATGVVAESEELPQYVDEQEKRLQEVDGALLDAQMARFRVVFSEEQDEEELKRVNEDFKKIQKERRDLLRATGKIY